MTSVKSQGSKSYKKSFQKSANTIQFSTEENKNMCQLPFSYNKEIDNQKLKFKNWGINRCLSEKTFKNFKIIKNKNLEPEITHKASQQYFPKEIVLLKKYEKPTFSYEKIEKINGIMKHSLNDKKKLEGITFKINNLKQTTSTQSAQNMGLHKQTPQFIKSTEQNISRRLFSPKNSLRRQNFRIILKLGQGKFGKVFLVKQIFTGFVLAMKIVEKKKIIRQGLLQQFIRELRIQGYLEHPNIISLYGFFSDQTHFYSLMQLGCDGQLYSMIESKKNLSQESTSFITKNLLQAINYIHANKVLHRDVKPQNIVLILGNVKICDFGWAANKTHPGDLRNTFCGTPIYLSPEIIQGKLYNEKVDLWAIGVLAFELLLGTTPFDIKNPNQLYRIVTDQIKFPQKGGYSRQFQQFARAILSKSPAKRQTSNKLLQMDFITKYRELETCQQLCK